MILISKSDLYGSGNMEMTLVDVVIETVDDAILASAKYFFEQDSTKKVFKNSFIIT